MSTLLDDSKSTPPASFEPPSGGNGSPDDAILCLRSEEYGDLVADCPALDEPERRQTLAEFLGAVLSAMADRSDASVEDFRRLLSRFGDLLRYSLKTRVAHSSLGLELLRLLHALATVAEDTDDLELWQRSLEWQVCARPAGNPRAQAYALLADFLVERAGDSATAGQTWVLAAREAESETKDRRATLSYWERAFAILGDDPVVAEALIIGYASAGDWSAIAHPFGVLLGKATGPQAVEHCIELLLEMKEPAIAQRASFAYATLIDEVLWSVSSDNASYARQLMLAKAQVIGAESERRDAALDAYYALLESHAVAGDQETLLEFIRGQSESSFRHDQLARYCEWRLGRGFEPASVLADWAKAEENEFGDRAAAAALLERIVAQDPSQATALREIRRLRELDEDWDGVELALSRLSELVSGFERDDVDFERAQVLSARLSCHAAALEIVNTALMRGADPSRARNLFEQLLGADEGELRLSAGEGLVALAAADGGERLTVVRQVLSATRDLMTDGGSLRSSALRRGWFEQAVSAWTDADDEGFQLASEAVVEFPDSDVLWDALGPWASHPARAKDIVHLYGRAIERTIDRELVEILGKKMLAFAESATVDVAEVLEVLMKVVRSAPSATWALDRVKLHLGAQGRWVDLLELYDSAMEEARANGDTTSEIHLLTEASVTAKDLAGDVERAIRYFERLFELNAKDTRTDSALERLYERHGLTERLVAHLERRATVIKGIELRHLQERIASLWIDAGRADPALEAIRNEIEARGDWPAATKLLERIFVLPSAREANHLEPTTAELASQLLATIHRSRGKPQELVTLLRESLPIVTDSRRKLLLLADLAETLETALGEEAEALQIVGEMLLLEPAEEWYRSWLGRLATRLDKPAERVQLLMRAAEPLPAGDTKARLLSEAAQVTRDVLDDATRAIELYGQVVECDGEAPDFVVLALEALDPLLAAQGYVEERCNVLECLAEATDSVLVRQNALRAVAQLAASELRDVDRAATNWRALLDEIPSDPEALEGFIAALEAQERWTDLAQTLSYRINIGEGSRHTIFDRKRLARIHAEKLGDSASAIAEWSGLLADDPKDYEARDCLSALLGDNQRWSELVVHLTSQLAQADDPGTLYRQLAEVHRSHTLDLRAATDALLQAGDVLDASTLLSEQPGSGLDDASLRLRVAEALRAFGHCQQSTVVLGLQLGLYGERKPKERSVVHLELARSWVLLERPDLASQELEGAIAIDPTNAEILATHGQLALELGALASAEQSYRSLLLLAMHSNQTQAHLPVLSVLYFRLAQIAAKRGDNDRADELIASAFDAAVSDKVQAQKLEQALIEARADDLLLKTLESQLGRATSVEQSAEVLIDFASRRLKLGEPSTQLLARLRDRADQISSAVAADCTAEALLRAHGPLVAVYRLLGDTECALALLLTWSQRFENTSVGMALEVEAAKLMLEFPERRAEGVDALLSTWTRDKSREDVADVLSVALGAEGRFEEQAALVSERIGKAERLRATDKANALRLELGALYERMGKLPEAALAFDSIVTATTAQRRAALVALSRVLVALGGESERLSRALEGLLEISDGRTAAETALELSKLYEDSTAVERVLAHGFAQDPSFEPVRERLIAQYRDTQQVEQARNILELAIARSPKDRKLVLDLLELSESASDAEGALRVLESALTYLPDDAELNRRRWQLLIIAGRHREALTALEREHARGAVSALEMARAIRDSGLAESSSQLRMREVELLLSAQAEDEARGRLLDWICTHDDDAEAHRLLARLAVKAKSWEEAIGSLLRLVQIDSPEAAVAAALDLAIACDKVGDPARAIPALERAKTFVSEHEELEQRLLKNYEATGDHARVAKLYVERSQRAGTGKKRVELLEQAAAQYLEGRSLSDALDCVEQALTVDVDKLSLLLTKVRILRLLNRDADARGIIEEQLSNPRHARDKERYRLFEILANMHLEADELVEAYEALGQAYKIDRTHPHVALAFGLVAADLDDAATAAGALRTAIAATRPGEKSPALSAGERASAYAELARLQLLRGSQTTARQLLDKAVEEDCNHHAVINLSRAMQRA